MAGLMRYQNGRNSKYLVINRMTGEEARFPTFVLGARDRHAPAALVAYAFACEQDGSVDQDYVDGVRRLADDFDACRNNHGTGKPDEVPPFHELTTVVSKNVITTLINGAARMEEGRLMVWSGIERTQTLELVNEDVKSLVRMLVSSGIVAKLALTEPNFDEALRRIVTAVSNNRNTVNA